MIGRLAVAVLPLSVMLACRGTPAPAVPSRPLPVDQRHAAADLLQRHVTDALADPTVAAGTWGVEVRSLSTRETLAAVNANRLLMPASTLKTITLAVAADQLGWDYTFETRLVASGSVANGRLDGDLIVIGSGDPSLDDWDGAADAVFASWATRLKEMGIAAVTGRVIGNDDAFDDEGFGSGWMWDDMADAYSAPASALQFNEGAAQAIVRPGSTVGEPASLALSPSYAPVAVQNLVRTAPAGAAGIVVRPVARHPVVELRGAIALDSPSQTRTIAVDNPTLYFAKAVRAGLIGNGIEVLGEAVDADELVDAPAADSGTLAATYRSPALPALADTLMKLSQNLYAETLLRTLGRFWSGTGSAEAGRKAVRDVLASWGVPASELLMADGSGLSRYNLVTADAMVSVLAHVYGDDRLRERYVASLPVAGRAGTLSARMKGTPADGNVQAKTGSFTNARAAAGFVRTADGEPLAFSIIANNYGVPAAEVDRVTDAIIVSLASFRRSVEEPR